jgi:hypothetical protein
VDPVLRAYYLADRTNAGIAAVSTTTDTFLGVVGKGSFSGATPLVTPLQKTTCGSAVAGPNGVLSLQISGNNQLWATDGVTALAPISTLKIFTLSSAGAGTLAAAIPTGNTAFGTTGTCRADEIAFDSKDNLVIVANNADSPPYISLISVNANPSADAVVAQIKFPTATSVEQPIYDAKTGMLYVNVPGVGLAEINPKTHLLKTIFAQPNCISSGIALDPQTQQFLVGCGINRYGSMLMDARTGSVLARFPQVSGSDELWFDTRNANFYVGANHMTSTGDLNGFNAPVLGVISGGTKSIPKAHWLMNISTGTVANNGHSVAVDSANHQIFLPMAGLGIAVFAPTRSSTGY